MWDTIYKKVYLVNLRQRSRRRLYSSNDKSLKLMAQKSRQDNNLKVGKKKQKKTKKLTITTFLSPSQFPFPLPSFLSPSQSPSLPLAFRETAQIRESSSTQCSYCFPSSHCLRFHCRCSRSEHFRNRTSGLRERRRDERPLCPRTKRDLRRGRREQGTPKSTI